ncbi:EAL domain-containing protein [uncultured Cellulomonas sp.]|uniref:EAL domain-containing protein n=1 Tax=uncultured Cellulomonas sp. TaxID=189682 RepID=UPI002603E13F|nr:EAL domain-containing protein [uncultured Cellulomonas sp.]
MSIRRSTSWAAFTRPPGGVGRRTVAATTGLMFAGGGALAWLVTLVGDGPDAGAGAIRALATVAVGMGAVIVLVGGRLWPVAHQAVLLGAWAMISVGVLVSGGGTVAMAIALLYLLIVVNVFTMTSWLAASVHGVLSVVGVVLALSRVPDVSTAATAMTAGVVVLVGVFAGRQVRATAAAEVDPLTGLLNRRGLDQRLGEMMSRAERTGAAPTLAVVDLDHFKAVNDRGGHAAGDLLLEAVARTWRAVVPAGAVVARTGGDEFVVLAPAGAELSAREVVERVRGQLPPGVTCSAGTAQWERGDSASMLISRADTALYLAKRTSRGTTRHHAGAMADATALRAAIADGRLEVHYQPVVELRTGRVVAAEALVRWRHPERGLVPPDEFVPQAELSGAIVDLGSFVLDRALHDAAGWPRGARGPRGVAVNVSGPELADPAYLTRVRAALDASGLPASALVIEITEGLLDLESPVVLGTLSALRAHGVRVAMDDFGTGYASLARLGQVQFDILKIDRSFVAVVGGPQSEAPLVTSILALAAALGLHVVAEGVQTADQADWLRDRGCHEGQGYLWSAPLPHAELLDRLRTDRDVDSAPRTSGAVPAAAVPAPPLPADSRPALVTGSVPTPRGTVPAPRGTVPAPRGTVPTPRPGRPAGPMAPQGTPPAGTPARRHVATSDALA